MMAIDARSSEVLTPVSLPAPVPGPGEATIVVSVADVLFLDTMIRSGRARGSLVPYADHETCDRGGAEADYGEQQRDAQPYTMGTSSDSAPTGRAYIASLHPAAQSFPANCHPTRLCG